MSLLVHVIKNLYHKNIINFLNCIQKINNIFNSNFTIVSKKLIIFLIAILPLY